MTIRLAILGSTGSIGANALRTIAELKDRFEIAALSADSNVELISRQAAAFRPKVICVGDGSLAAEARGLVPKSIRIVFGSDGLKEIVSRGDVDLALFAISGSSCLVPLVHAIEHKKRIALANKESLVSAGSIIMNLAKRNNVKIVPIDSEHSAIFQCLEGKMEFLHKIYLTGSGGPLLNVPERRFDSLSRSFILKHPKWKMGKKISVDSATMMNKGLEIIEACHLFDITEDRIDVVIHPEAVIHSMVELVDGVLFAQLGIPDMRIPIQYALTYPFHVKNTLKRLDFFKVEQLSFHKPDTAKFPCLELAREAARAGGTSPAVLSVSDEEVVKAYLEGRITLSRIPKILERILKDHRNIKDPSLGDILEAEERAKRLARAICCH